MVKGIVSGIKRMEIHDGEGLRTTVFMKGCPLKCIWCHNPESISYTAEIGKFVEKCINCGSCVNVCPTSAMFWDNGGTVFDKNKCNACFKCETVCPVSAIVAYGQEYTVDGLLDEIIKDKPFFGRTGGVTFSGGECLTQADFIIECIRRLKEQGIGVYIDTCGFINREILDKILPYVDKFLYDIKAVDEELHKRLTGIDNKRILDNLKYLAEKNCMVEIRYPLVKGYNDCECEKIGEFLRNLGADYPIKILRYHDFARSRYSALQKEDTLPKTKTRDEDIDKARKILQDFGIKTI